jgi:hypothetical protein
VEPSQSWQAQQHLEEGLMPHGAQPIDRSETRESVSPELLEARLKDTRETIEKRLLEDRDFIKSILGLVAKVCAAAFIIVVGTFGFFGYKDLSSIDDKISKSVSEKIEEKSKTFADLYEKQIQGTTDQALATSYNIQFAAPKKRFSREQTVIGPAHLQRFLQILGDQKADSKILNQIYDLLSDPTHDGSSGLVRTQVWQMVGASGSFAWVKNDADRLAKLIDILRARSDKTDPSTVRAHLKNETSPPAVRDSAVLYAEALQDREAVPYIERLLGDGTQLPPEDAFFAIASLRPEHKSVKGWFSDLEARVQKGEKSPDLRERLGLSARVVAKMLTAADRRRTALSAETESPGDKLAADLIALIIKGEGRISLDTDHFAESSRPAYQVILNLPGDGFGRIVPSDLLLGPGSGAITAVCRRMLGTNSISGLNKLVKQTAPPRDRGSRLNYSLRVRVRGESKIRVNVDGMDATIADTFADLTPGSSEEDTVKASWRTDEGVVKTGKIIRLEKPELAIFSFYVRGDAEE